MTIVLVMAAFFAKSGPWKWDAYGLPPSELKTCVPDTRGKNDSWWLPYVQNKLKQPKHDLLFLGDSITDLWTYPADHRYPGGLDTWNIRFKDIATNYGVTGDKTQTVLWRVTEGGALNGYAPKHIVLLIGINNLLQGDNPEDTAEGKQSDCLFPAAAFARNADSRAGDFSVHCTGDQLHTSKSPENKRHNQETGRWPTCRIC